MTATHFKSEKDKSQNVQRSLIRGKYTIGTIFGTENEEMRFNCLRHI